MTDKQKLTLALRALRHYASDDSWRRDHEYYEAGCDGRMVAKLAIDEINNK